MNGFPSQNYPEKPANEKKRKFLLFGQIISPSSLSDTASDRAKAPFGPKSLPNSSLSCSPASNIQDLSLKVGTCHCKIFMESEDVGRTLDLSVLGSYEELHNRLVTMFETERSDLLDSMLYEDGMGVVRKAGSEPFRLVFRK